MATEIMREENYERIKASKSRGEEPEKYQIQFMARPIHPQQNLQNTVLSSARLPIGSNQLIVNVRGTYYGEKFRLGHTSNDGFERPIRLKFGPNLLTHLSYFGLEEMINEVGENHRNNDGFEKTFVKEVLDVTDKYLRCAVKYD